MVRATPLPVHSWSLAFLARSNVIVVILTACAVLFTRSAGVAYCALGAIMSSLGAKVLKKAIRQPRPSNGSQRKETYGMPSTHSAVTAYFACYICLSCFYLPLHPSVRLGPALTAIFPVVLLPCSTSVMLSRIWLGHHTWPQVAVGTMYGITFGLGWFITWIKGINAYGQDLEQHFVGAQGLG